MFYFIEQGNQVVKYSVGGQTASVTFAVVAPSPSASVFFTNPNPSIQPVYQQLLYGPSIEWQLNSTGIPQGYSGQFGWFQVVNSTLTTRTHISNGQMTRNNVPPNTLDLGVPYSYGNDGDQPSDLLCSGLSQVTRNDSFTLYLMFQPSYSSAIWVPVRSAFWDWAAVANYSSSSGWSLASPGSYLSALSQTSSFPVWNGLVQNYLGNCSSF